MVLHTIVGNSHGVDQSRVDRRCGAGRGSEGEVTTDCQQRQHMGTYIASLTLIGVSLCSLTPRRVRVRFRVRPSRDARGIQRV